MKNMRLLLWAVAFFWGTTNLFAQINSGNPAVPFGSNLKYGHGIMPTNLPSTGQFKRSQDAADQYLYWLNQFVEPCNDGSYRVKFTDATKTVSEGIAYGMLLSAYAGDKEHFDGFYKFFDASKNVNQLMHWMTDGCNGNARDNSATDADLDIAHALMIASEQWPNATEDYKSLAKGVIGRLMKYEIDPVTKITWSGDFWKDYNILNPSYQSPAYYRQFAKFDKTASYASTWAEVAAASEELLGKNADATTGLISNWCDKDGVANANGPNNPYVGYGSDACRGPWRMATDVLWHGATDTATFAYGLCKKMSDWLAGYESNLRGKMVQTASNPTEGAHSNGSYTTFALAVMAMDDSYQQSLNKCYTFTAGMSHDGDYFNETVRTLSLFCLTGNFWKPGTSGIVSSPEVFSAETNEDGTEITVVFTDDMNTSALGSASDFVVGINGADQSGAVTAIVAKGTDGIVLTVKPDVCEAGKAITLAYKGSTIEALGGAKLEMFTDQYVKNNLLGNSTMVDNCDDGNATNLLGGVWYTYTDGNDGGASKVVPLSTKDDPLPMLGQGADGSAAAAHVTFKLDKGTFQYNPYVGIGCDLNGADLSGTTGMSFWYKGAGADVRIVLPTVTDFSYHTKHIDSKDVWTEIYIPWTEFGQPTWSQSVQALDLSIISEFQWQVQGPAATINAGNTFLDLDFVVCEGLVPTDLVSFEVEEATDAVVDIGADVVLYTTPSGADQFSDTTLHVVYNPTDATYKEVIWASSNPAVADVLFNGDVTAYSSGLVTMTAKSVIDESIVATCQVKVFGDEVLPDSVRIATPAKTTISVAEELILSATIKPDDVDDKTIIWTSSALGVAVVDNGTVTGVGAGTVTIRAISAMDNSVYDEIEITVEGATSYVQAVDITEDAITINTGEKVPLDRTITPTTATDTTLSWVSLDEDYVKVDGGVIEGVAETTTPIMVIATATDQGTVKDTIYVTVEDKVVLATKVTLNKSVLELALNGSEQLTVTVEPDGLVTDPSVEWKSLDPDFVTVDPDGTVHAKAATTTPVGVVVTTKDGSNKSATCYVSVKGQAAALVESVTIKDGDIELTRNESTTLTVEVLPATADNKDYTLVSLNEEFVKIDATGKVVAVKTGSAKVVAKADDASGMADTILVTVNPILVTKINVADKVTVLQGEKKTIAFTVEPADADDTSVEWTLDSGSDVLSITDNEFTGSSTATGEATVTVSALGDGSNNVSATITVTVTDQEVNVNSITIKETLSLEAGKSEMLAVTFDPAEPTEKGITWSTDGTGYATVNELGKVTAVSPGVTKVIAKSKDEKNGIITDTCTVTVTASLVEGITIQNTLPVEVDSAKTVTIIAEATPTAASNRVLKYTSLNTSIATVDPATGVVTGVKPGTATIKVAATDASGVSETITVTVKAVQGGSTVELISLIVLSETELSLTEGESAALVVKETLPSEPTNAEIEWSSTNLNVVKYENGKVVAVGPGTAAIIASSADAGNAVASCIVTVAPDVDYVTDLLVDQSSISLEIGGTKTIVVTVKPDNADNEDYEWSTSNSDVVTVSSTGKVTAKGSGQAYVKVVALDGSGVETIVPVSVVAGNDVPLATSIVISGTVPTMEVDDVLQVVATVLSTSGTPDQAVEWLVSDEDVIKLSGTNLQAVGSGTATLTAIAKDGSFVKKVVEITVKTPTIATDGIEASVDEIELLVGDITFYTAAVTPNEATEQTVTVSVDNDGIVEIDEARGAITAKAEGTVKVTFKAKGTNFTKVETITVTEPVVEFDESFLENTIDLAENAAEIGLDAQSGTVIVAAEKLEDAITKAKKALRNAEVQEDINDANDALLAAIEKYNAVFLTLDSGEEFAGETAVFPTPAVDVVTVVGSGLIQTVSAVVADGASTILATGVNATVATVSVEGLATGMYTIVIVYADGSSETVSVSKL